MREQRNGRPIYFTIAATMLVFLLAAAVGPVSSFGSTADVGSSSSSSSLQRNQNRNRQQSSIATTALASPLSATKSPLFRKGSNAPSTTQLPLSPSASSASASSSRFLVARQSASATDLEPETTTKKKRSLLRRILWNANPLAGRTDDRWKGGEAKATIASRLLFSYVSPLLDVVGGKNLENRTLTEDDAFALAQEHRSMEYAVESLAGTYDLARTKARRRLEEKKQQASSNSKKSKEVVKNSESLVLLKAIVRNQKSLLLLTGIQRLTNTFVQAFPSLLVARFLRSIEAGPTAPIQESFKAVVLLVAVLCLKMVTENQFFHNVVSMSTRIRGSVEGLIFDKSLRLPEGGSGVLTKHIGGGKKTSGANNGSKAKIKESSKKALGSGGVSRKRRPTRWITCNRIGIDRHISPSDDTVLHFFFCF